MKKVFYLILLLLVMPFIANAKELELKSIETVGNYSDVVATLTGSEEASVNFFAGGTDFSPITKYNLTIENSSNNIYTLNLDYLNTDDMKVRTNTSELKPGSNKIELTIEREEIDPRFTPSVPSSEAKLISSMKENPNTGLMVAKILIFVTILTVIALTLYIKTKRSSSFLVLILLLIIPGIIIAKESTTFKIKINTFINNEYETCMLGLNYIYESFDPTNGNYVNDALSYTFTSDETILNTDNDQQLLQVLFSTDTKLTKSNIINFIRNMEDSKVYEKEELEKHVSSYDQKTEEYLPVEGKDNITYDFAMDVETSPIVAVYNDTPKKLELLISFKDPIATTEDGRGYQIYFAKIVFNKKNNDYYIDVQNLVAYVEGSSEICESMLECLGKAALNNSHDETSNIIKIIYDYVNNNMVPVLNIKTHMDKKVVDMPMLLESYDLDGTKYYINDQEATEEELNNYLLNHEFSYVKATDNHTSEAAYALFSSKICEHNKDYRRNPPVFQKIYNGNYKIASTSNICFNKAYDIYMGTNWDLTIGDRYMPVFSTPACYVIGIPD